MTQVEGAFRASSCCSFETSGVRGVVIRSIDGYGYDKEKALTTSQDQIFTHYTLIHTEYRWRLLKIIDSCWRLLNILDVIEVVVDAHWSCVEAAGEKVEVTEGQEERRPVLKSHMSSVGRSEYPSTQDTQVQFL